GQRLSRRAGSKPADLQSRSGRVLEETHQVRYVSGRGGAGGARGDAAKIAATQRDPAGGTLRGHLEARNSDRRNPSRLSDLPNAAGAAQLRLASRGRGRLHRQRPGQSSERLEDGGMESFGAPDDRSRFIAIA